jgi:hypothetical protein
MEKESPPVGKWRHYCPGNAEGCVKHMPRATPAEVEGARSPGGAAPQCTFWNLSDRGLSCTG